MATNTALKFNFDAYGMTFFARHLHRLRVVISDQSDTIFEQAGITVPAHCASVMLLLAEHEETPVMKLADALGYSHQLLIQRITLLEKHGCVRKYKDPSDRRKSLVSLSKRGRNEVRKVQEALPIIDAGIRDVLSGDDGDLQQKIRDVRLALLKSPLSERGRAGEF